MKLGIYSDIHIDHNVDFDFIKLLDRPDLDALIIAGDISSDYEETYEFLRDLSRKNKMVLVAMGNHDYYSNKQKTLVDVHNYYEDNLSKLKNVFNLNNTSILLDGWKFSGCTGWFPGQFNHNTNFPDFKHIGLFESQRPQIYRNSHEFIYKNRGPKTIFVTHHIPYDFLINEDVRNNENVKYYCMKLPQVAECKMWIYGHSHITDDKTFHGIRYVNNPFGYRNYEQLENDLLEIEI